MAKPSAEIVPRTDKNLEDILRICQPARVAEFGSWEGRSAIGFVLLAQQIGFELRVTCIDTWLGSREHWLNSAPGTEWSRNHLKIRDGEPLVIETFRRAVRDYSLERQISILRAPTAVAAEYLASHGEVFSMVYVDADHSYSAVLQDLGYAQRLLGHTGVIAGDDWHWPSVRRAVLMFSLRSNLVPWIPENGATFVLLLKGDRARAIKFESEGWRKVTKAYSFSVLSRFALKRTARKLRFAVDSVYVGLGMATLRSKLAAARR